MREHGWGYRNKALPGVRKGRKSCEIRKILGLMLRQHGEPSQIKYFLRLLQSMQVQV
jgi:hypothetical protein